VKVIKKTKPAVKSRPFGKLLMTVKDESMKRFNSVSTPYLCERAVR